MTGDIPQDDDFLIRQPIVQNSAGFFNRGKRIWASFSAEFDANHLVHRAGSRIGRSSTAKGIFARFHRNGNALELVEHLVGHRAWVGRVPKAPVGRDRGNGFQLVAGRGPAKALPERVEYSVPSLCFITMMPLRQP